MKIISRSEAKLQKLTHYFTGVPCKRNHVDERYVSTRTCVSCRKHHFEKNSNCPNINEREKARQRTDEYRRKVNERRRTEEYKIKAEVYRRNNNDKINETRRNYYHNNENFRMSVICRSMLGRVLNLSGNTKKRGSYETLGYTASELIRHLGSLFTDGMTWGNYGEWHIDHIVPVSWWLKNGVTDPSMVNALINLQPLWAKDNLAKSDKI